MKQRYDGIGKLKNNYEILRANNGYILVPSGRRHGGYGMEAHDDEIYVFTDVNDLTTFLFNYLADPTDKIGERGTYINETK